MNHRPQTTYCEGAVVLCGDGVESGNTGDTNITSYGGYPTTATAPTFLCSPALLLSPRPRTQHSGDLPRMTALTERHRFPLLHSHCHRKNYLAGRRGLCRCSWFVLLDLQ